MKYEISRSPGAATITAAHNGEVVARFHTATAHGVIALDAFVLGVRSYGHTLEELMS